MKNYNTLTINFEGIHDKVKPNNQFSTIDVNSRHDN